MSVYLQNEYELGLYYLNQVNEQVKYTSGILFDLTVAPFVWQFLLTESKALNYHN